MSACQTLHLGLRQGSIHRADLEVAGAYYNTKDQVNALEELRQRLPDLETPAPAPSKRDRARRARQLTESQTRELIAGYQSGSTVYELGDQFGEQ